VNRPQGKIMPNAVHRLQNVGENGIDVYLKNTYADSESDCGQICTKYDLPWSEQSYYLCNKINTNWKMHYRARENVLPNQSRNRPTWSISFPKHFVKTVKPEKAFN